MLIAPSLLAADFANLQRDIEMVNESQADWFHLDIYGWALCPEYLLWHACGKSHQRTCQKTIGCTPYDCRPRSLYSYFCPAGSSFLSVHYEACTHLHRTVQAIRQEGMKAGVALNPHTPIAVLEDIITDVDLLLIMSVNPGFGGQSFIENTYKKGKSSQRTHY